MGKLSKTTLPVAVAQVGCVIVPIVGGLGIVNGALISTFAEAEEIQPSALVTVKVWGPAVNPDIVIEVVLPVIPPGFIVQFPVGKPVSKTLPVVVEHVGCVIVPTIGAGFGLTVITTDF